MKNFDRTNLLLNEFISNNDEMNKCIELAKAASQTTASILITGESGVGKKLLSQAIHLASNRANNNLITLSCSAIPPAIIESELFGHDRNNIQDVEKPRRGKLEQADKGTLIIEDIGELPSEVQAKLLRTIEYNEFERCRGEEIISTNVRVIALSSKNISQLVTEGKFREDLYYRLNEIAINIPPLRQRREDIQSLISFQINNCNNKFNKNIKDISQIAFDYLMRYDFPGNIRELQSLIKRGVTVAKSELLWLEDLGMRVEVPTESEAIENPEELFNLAVIEKRHIQYVLNYTKGNKKRAADLLQVSRPTLDRKISIYNLRLP